MQRAVGEAYGAEFYAQQGRGSRLSASIVLPIVLRMTRATSIIDVGCGTGGWLQEARRLGVGRLMGIEGEWARRQLDGTGLAVEFRNLEESCTLEDRFDLAMSLEVAEHLSGDRATSFVADLCASADIVLFSAAIPGQDGASHKNEQWPSYWAERFAWNGFLPLDVIRPIIQTDPKVELWYRTNTMLYARPARAAEIIGRADGTHLEGLDLAAAQHAAGVKRASRRLLESGRSLGWWLALRVVQSIGLKPGVR